MWGARQKEKPRQMPKSQSPMTWWVIVQLTEVRILGRMAHRAMREIVWKASHSDLSHTDYIWESRCYLGGKFRSVSWISETGVQMKGLEEWRAGFGDYPWIGSHVRKKVCKETKRRQMGRGGPHLKAACRRRCTCKEIYGRTVPDLWKKSWEWSITWA